MTCRKSFVFAVLALIAYSFFTIFVAEGMFDASGNKWRSALPRGELARIENVRVELNKLQNEDIPWGTLVEFTDGKVGLVIKGDMFMARHLVLAVISSGIYTAPVNRPDWEVQRILRVIHPTDTGYENGLRRFLGE